MDLHNLANLYFKNDAETVLWFVCDNPLLEDKSPMELVTTGESDRLRLVIEMALLDQRNNENHDQDDEEL